LVRIRDLARQLDISIGTVSRALNDRADVNPETRLRVREAAARLGYSPNQSARSLRRGRTELVGMIVPTGSRERFIDAVFQPVLDGLRGRLGQEGLDLAIFLHGRDEELFGSLKRVVERGLVDALVISNTLPEDPRIDYLVARAKPFAAFGRSRSVGDFAWVDPDFEGAVERGVARLAALGHRKIGLLTSDDRANFVDLIRASHRRALRRLKLPFDARIDLSAAPGEAGGVEAVGALLGEDRASAVLVADPQHASGLYTGLAARGMKVGVDLSIMGVLPGPFIDFLTPTLAAFATDWNAIGVTLAEALIQALSGEDGRAPIRQIVPVVYRDGASVGPA